MTTSLTPLSSVVSKYLTEDGTFVVVSGGSDAGTADPPAVEPAPAAAPAAPEPGQEPALVEEGAAPAPSSGPAPATHVTSADVDLDADLPDGDSFDRKYVESLRKEAAKHRTDAAPFRDVFKDVPDEERTMLLDLTRTILSDPNGAGAKELLRWGKALAGDKFDDVLASADEPEYLTPQQLEEKLAAREAAAEQQRTQAAEVAAIEKQRADLGYEESGPDTSVLYHFAVHDTDGDIDAAHEKVKVFKQGIIDAFVEEQRAANGGHPPVSSNTGTGPADPGGSAPKTFADARAAAEARLAAAPGDVA